MYDTVLTGDPRLEKQKINLHLNKLPVDSMGPTRVSGETSSFITYATLETSVDFFNSGLRNPATICVSGQLVMKNLTPGISETNLPNTRRTANSGSLSLHSSRASITIVVEISVDLSGSTRNLCIWSWSDSWTTSGFDRRSGMSEDRKAGYLCVSWNASVGNMSWRFCDLHGLSSRKRTLPNGRLRTPFLRWFARLWISLSP